MNLFRETWVVSGPSQLAVQDYGGTGALMLLLHGAGRSAADWLPMAPVLAKTSHVVSMDLRGHGRSSTGPMGP
ncbi:alpha/beta fold hydrolase [Paraburkholderia oxyphila]|uniref:alpha/beta fold hydrolase n=1 Tax=Paraburkholderia oxyphila TaxID=614212 RepID=UPI0012ED6E27